MAVALLAACVARGAVQPVAGAVATNTPALVCPVPRFDFGQVYPDTVVSHTFTLTNTGSRVVRILNVHATCGCSKAEVSSNAVAPSASVELKVEINLKGRRGRQDKAVYVRTDEPVNGGVMRLETVGTVIVPIEAQPEGVHFGTLGRDGSVEREVLLTAVGTNTFHVRSVTSSSTQILPRVETKEIGHKYVVKLVAEGPRTVGSMMASVRVETDHPRLAILDIPVAAFVTGDIVSAPGLLLLIPSPTNMVRSSWLNLWSPAGKSFSVTRVVLPGEGLTNTVTRMTPDRVRLEIKSWGSLTGVDGKPLRIETDLGSMKEVLIPVKVLPPPKDPAAPVGP